MAVVTSPVCVGLCPSDESGESPVTNCIQLQSEYSLPLRAPLNTSQLIYSDICCILIFPPLAAQTLGQEQPHLRESSADKRAAEINCNGVTDLAGPGNEGSVRLQDDLHNANDCGNHPHTQKAENLHGCHYSQHNSDSENRPQEAMLDSFVPLAPEDSMVCQPTPNQKQAFSEQGINNFQESIRTETPSEDENENNSSTDNKGIRGTL